MTGVVVVAILAGTSAAAPLSETNPVAFLLRWLDSRLRIATEINRIRPPVPVQVRWRARILATVPIAGPALGLAALAPKAAAQAELVLVTERDVSVLSRDGRGLALRSAVALPGEALSARSRDPVGTLDVQGDRIFARSSSRSAGVELVHAASGLLLVREIAGFPACGGSLRMAAGINQFSGADLSWRAPGGGKVALPPYYWSVGCGDQLVGPDGRAIEVFTSVDPDGNLRAQCRRLDGTACPGISADLVVPRRGYAHAITDVDTDGYPDLVTTELAVPGAEDVVTIFSLRRDSAMRLHERRFQRGVVAVTVMDLDGDGTKNVVVAERGGDPSTLTLWELNL